MNLAVDEKLLCIGMFGSCGPTTWRLQMIEEYQKIGAEFYNPQIPGDEWDLNPEKYAKLESMHLAHDQIILFPVLPDTFGLGSLGETGFSILNAIKIDNLRHFVIMIAPEPAPELKAKDPAIFKESVRLRTLVKAHLQKQRMDTVYVVDSLEEMLEVSLKLYEAVKITTGLLRYNPHRRDWENL